MPKLLVITLFFLMPLSCFAQYTISGKILNSATKKPVANADVFINNSTGGTTTYANGDFKLFNIRNGKYTLIISEIGYNDMIRQIQVNNNDIDLGDIILVQSNKTLKEVVIKPKEIPSEYFYNFKEQFLGKSDIAHDCRILNPEILDIGYNRTDSSYTASSDGYLIIENPDLGYRIKYKLLDFYYMSNIDSPVIRYHGYVHFEQMAGKPTDIRRWERKRYDIYKNSAIHFYNALIANRLDEEGFKVQQYAAYLNFKRPPDSVILKKIEYYKHRLDGGGDDMSTRDTIKYWERELKQPKIIRELRSYPLEQADLLRPTDQHNLFAFGCDFDKLFVTYNENKHFDPNIKLQHLVNPRNTECTLINFNSPFAFIDRYGSLTDPYDVSYMGVWANQRTGDLLPVDYSPMEMENVITEPVDSTVSKNVIAKLNDYNANHITEKAYLHFDRPYYAAGDTMFFKAYITTGDDHQPSIQSSILHVDLIDGKGQINKSIALGIVDGLAWGDFVLPDSLAGGNYQVRAYTEWMRNTGQQDFFDKVIPIAAVTGIKSGARIGASAQSASAKPDIQFFPEGGNWVAGIRTKIAFKALSPNGFGVEIKGYVIDNGGNKVGSFSSEHKGMGYFYLTGEVGKTYRANITYANGVQDLVNLPALQEKGIAMSVNNDSAQIINIKILSDPQYLRANKKKDYTLVVYSNGKAMSLICKLDNPEVGLSIYKRELHSGITRLTLFAPDGEPLCERLVFVQNFDELKLKVNTDKAAYATKDKVLVKLNVLDDDNSPTIGHFSVSVTDENKLPVDANNEHTILTDMLLTSALKGYVEQPNYYFNNPTPEVLSALDILMLTQGYSRFEWKQVLNDNSPVINYPAETSLSLSGTLKTMSGKPVAGGTVTLLSTKHALAKDTTTDSNGNFKFTGLYLTDTAKLVLHGHTKNNNDKVSIEISKDIPAAFKLNNPDTSMAPITPEMAAAMKKRYEQSGSIKTGILLKQVNISRKAKQNFRPELTHSDNLNGAGNADQVIMGNQLVGCPDIRECLKALLHGVYTENGIFYNERTHVEILTGRRQPMVFIIDGLVSGQTEGGGIGGASDMLSNLAASDIYSIEVLLSTSYLSVYGSDASAGAIVITTKRGGESTVVNTDGSIYYTFHGFQKARTFYSPKYDVKTAISTYVDQRTTIYWQPELTTDSNGNADFAFFNSADPGIYRIVVEGMDAKGNPGRHVYHYTVK